MVVAEVEGDVEGIRVEERTAPNLPFAVVGDLEGRARNGYQDRARSVEVQQHLRVAQRLLLLKASTLPWAGMLALPRGKVDVGGELTVADQGGAADLECRFGAGLLLQFGGAEQTGRPVT